MWTLRVVHTISFLGILCCSCALAIASGVKLQRDDTASQLTVLVDGREVMVYQYGDKYALPHYWPLRSPSGKLLTVQHPDPYPNHRSLWIADKIHAAGAPPLDFYHCWKNYRDPGVPDSGFRHFIRHEEFGTLKSGGNTAIVEAKLRWIVNDTQPVLDEYRELRVVAWGNDECRLDLSWELKASYGDVKFMSDKVHYAWPSCACIRNSVAIRAGQSPVTKATKVKRKRTGRRQNGSTTPIPSTALPKAWRFSLPPMVDRAPG